MERRFILNQPVLVEETLHCEFKEVKGGNPVKAIANTVDEYVVAYLNSKGGNIYWGIRDLDRTVVGVTLYYKQRDDLRKAVISKLTNIQPPISPTACQMYLHEIYESATSEKPVPDLSLVEVVAPRGSTDDLYFTGGNEAFVKTAAGKKKFSGPELQDEILRRLRSRSKDEGPGSKPRREDDFGFPSVLRRADMVAPILQGAQILWVDDNPGNNILERMTLKSMGIDVDLAISTNEALLMLAVNNYDAVISDMERQGSSNAGLQLLCRMRERGLFTQVVFYIGRVDRDRGTPPGAFGITSYPDDLMHYVLDILERERISRWANR